MEQRIEYKGMTSQPSDYQCGDGEMKVAVNAEYRDGGYHAVKMPNGVQEKFDNLLPLFIHKPSSYKKEFYICVSKSNDVYTLYAYCSSRESIEIENNVTTSNIDDFGNFKSIGNIVIFIFQKKIKMLIFKEGSYYILDRMPPSLNVDFKILRRYDPNIGITSSEYEKPSSSEYVNYNVVNVDETYKNLWVTIENAKISNTTEMTWARLLSESDNVTKYKNAVFAAYNSSRAYLQKKGYLMNPVLLRYAYRLYDGSLIMPSAPILMYPPIKPVLFYKLWNKHNRITEKADQPLSIYFEAYKIFASSNDLDVMNELSEKWRDIIKSVDFFISPQIYTIETDELDYYMLDGSKRIEGADFAPQSVILSFKERNFEESLKSVSSFHFIHSIDIDKLSDCIGESQNAVYNLTDKNRITPDDLTSYTERESLVDSLYSNSDMETNTIYSINNRLCVSSNARLLNIKNGISDVVIYNETSRPEENKWTEYYNHKITYHGNEVRLEQIKDIVTKENTNSLDLHTDYAGIIAYKVDSDEGLSSWVSSHYSCIAMPKYFFSIDNRISAIGLIQGDSEDEKKIVLHEFKLKKSDYINTSFNLNQGCTDTNIEEETFNKSLKETIRFSTESLVKLSEVNNPFVFKDGNSASCGAGSVLAIASNSRAVSKGQFGQYPLFAFCTDGVYAIGVGTDGTLQNCSPYSYDVITDSKSVSNMESSVVFVTKQGVIALGGEGRQLLLSADKTADYKYDEGKEGHQKKFVEEAVKKVVGLSSPPAMTDLHKYLTTGARIAYDYPHGRLIVYNPNHDYSYVMEAASGMWSVMTQKFHSNLNVYEECLMVKEETEVVNEETITKYNVYNYSTDNVVEKQHAYLITRPFKLGYPDVHKTIQSIIQRGVFCSKNDVQQCMYGSNDLYNWVPVWSSKDIYMRGFMGTGYKYYRMILFIPEFKQDETLQGASVSFEPRMTNKQR